MRAPRLLFSALLLTAAPLLAALPADAQAGCEDIGASTHIVRGHIVFPRPELSHFLAGQITHPQPIRIVVDARRKHEGRLQVCVRTPDASLGHGKPVGDLQFYNGETGQWQPLRNELTLVSTASSEVQRVFTIPVRMVLNWETDRPGVYGPTPLLFQVSSR